MTNQEKVRAVITALEEDARAAMGERLPEGAKIAFNRVGVPNARSAQVSLKGPVLARSGVSTGPTSDAFDATFQIDLVWPQPDEGLRYDEASIVGFDLFERLSPHALAPRAGESGANYGGAQLPRVVALDMTPPEGSEPGCYVHIEFVCLVVLNRKTAP